MWQTISVYYYEDNKDELLLEVWRRVLQLKEQYNFLFYFRRHWKMGPHIRLNFFADDVIFDQIKECIVVHIENYLKDKPSTKVLDERKLLRLYEQLGRVEREEHPYGPFVPDNTVLETEYDSRSRFNFEGYSSEQMANTMTSLIPVTFGIIQSTKYRGHDRELALLLLMFCLANNGKKNSLSFHSHAEGFLHMVKDRDKVLRLFEERYEKIEDSSLNLANCIFQGEHQNLSSSLQDIRLLWNEASQLFFRSASTVGETHFQTVSQPGAPKGSAFHSEVYASPEIVNYLNSQSFQVVRLALNYLYLLVAQVGLTPMDKFFLCWSAARTIDTVIGQDWSEQLEQWNGPQGGKGYVM